jgi:hypothetical protein
MTHSAACDRNQNEELQNSRNTRKATTNLANYSNEGSLSGRLISIWKETFSHKDHKGKTVKRYLQRDFSIAIFVFFGLFVA